jgi:hypothetical protein
MQWHVRIESGKGESIDAKYCLKALQPSPTSACEKERIWR